MMVAARARSASPSPPVPGGSRPTSADGNDVVAHPTVDVLAVRFAAISTADAVAAIGDAIAHRRRGYVVLANAHTLNLAFDDAAYRDVLRGAALVLRDGIGIELAARINGRTLADNFVGTDFVPALLAALAHDGVRAFLFGSAPGVAERAAAELDQRCGRPVTVGWCDGYDERATVVDRIRAARPDVVLVGLGNPAQEVWMAEHVDTLDVPVMIGVGALFDFLSGRVPRAPLWVRRIRCEWIYRLWHEPRRLAARYLVGIPKFLWRVLTARRNAA